MTIELRYYQKDALAALYNYFMHKSGNPIVALPTGTGKSIIIAEWARYCTQAYPGTRIIMLTHVKELIEQNFEKLLKVWPTAPAGIFSAGIGRKDTAFPITFAGIQSIASQADKFGHVDMLLIDECHLVGVSANTRYQQFISDLRQVNPHLRVIGLSATPYRQGLGLLTESNIFTDIAYDCTDRDEFAKLMAEGYIAPLVPKQTQYTMNTDQVKIQGGDYVLNQLQEMFSGADTNVKAVREALLLAQDRNHLLVFTTGIAHAETVADIFNSFGISATHVHSKISSEQRKKNIADFKDGSVRVMVNSNVLTTGFDFPELDCEIILRPTRAAGLWVQMLGRGTRPAPGKKDCLVLDFAGNTARLGPINDPVIPRKKGSRGGGSAPIKVCPTCFTLLHTSVRHCDQCGYEFIFNETPISTKASTLDLVYVPKNVEPPNIVEYTVDRVTYRRHTKKGRPDSIKVTYHCNLLSFKTYLCFEHGGYATTKAKEWWRKMTDVITAPHTTDDALLLIDKLAIARKIRVWIKTDYNEILDYII